MRRECVLDRDETARMEKDIAFFRTSALEGYAAALEYAVCRPTPCSGSARCGSGPTAACRPRSRRGWTSA